MGIYDREYYREEQVGYRVRGPQTIVGGLIAVNVALYLADLLFSPQRHVLMLDILPVTPDTLTHPLYWWKFLTYGFAHSPPPNFWHIVGNMLVLFFLGPDIELRYGSKEFLRLYLLIVVAGGVVWAATARLQGHDRELLFGASGGVVGVVILYALNFPRRTLLLFGIVPMPAWLLGALTVASDVWGSLRGPVEGTQTAYVVHLTGAAIAFLYYRFHWNLGSLMPGQFSLRMLQARPKLRVHDPADDQEDTEHDMATQVDRILEKIHRNGEASLTRQERKVLEDASRQYQRRRNN